MKTRKRKKHSMTVGEAVAKAADHFGLTPEAVAKFCKIGCWPPIRDFVRLHAGTDEVAAEDVKSAHRIIRERDNAYFSRLVEQNARPNVRMANVVVGHHELDPALNSEHPCNRGRRAPVADAEQLR